MDIEKAIRVVGRQRPCEHENHDTRIGDGQTWARCEDCGVTFAREGLARRVAVVAEFDDAMEVITKAARGGAK